MHCKTNFKLFTLRNKRILEFSRIDMFSPVAEFKINLIFKEAKNDNFLKIKSFF